MNKRMATTAEPVNVEGGNREEEAFFREYFKLKQE